MTASRPSGREPQASGGARGFEGLLAAKEVVIACGSGGVGKTSVSAALALHAAVHQGGKVLVLTVDPARRLATALGLESIGNLERQVPREALESLGVAPRGELWAAMLDTKQSWDALVMRHAPDELTAVRILENRLYNNLTARFVQSHDYIAMERLYELHSSGEYDLIVVDTPPSRHAIDFLDAPQRMADFFGGRLLRWLTLPYRAGGGRGARMINVASRPFYQIADRILGSRFLEEIAEFFLNFQSMYDGFVERAHAVEHLLHDRRTTFAVVTTLEAAPLHEAQHFIEELRARKFSLGAVICNRTLPSWFTDARALTVARTLADAPHPVADDLSDVVDDVERTARVLRTVGESFVNFNLVARREAELRAELARDAQLLLDVPTQSHDIADLSGLAELGARLGGLSAMTTFDDVIRDRTDLTDGSEEHLRRLVTAWRALADLSFSDLQLLAPVRGESGHRFVVLAHVRPTTGQTLYPMDLVGTVIDEIERPMLTRVWRVGEIAEGDAPIIGGRDRVRVQTVPVRYKGELVALLTREYVPNTGRRTGELERSYFDVFSRFALMLTEGTFPFDEDEVELETAPRVGDGALVLDDEQRVRFASPNAISSLHRMGIHAYAQGMRLDEIGFDDRAVRDAVDEHRPVLEEFEHNDVVVVVRAIPLLDADVVSGLIVLIRDVTDVRRRDRMLMSKDATIREIHHRVKNNLQTIASLLRLQRRRLKTQEAKDALAESERRIRSIAIVHETLSRDAGDVVDFTEIVRPLVRVVEESVSSEDLSLRFTVEGDAGELPGEVATPLAVVLNELMQNAVDHTFAGRSAGTVLVRLTRDDESVVVEVADDGAGLPDHFSLESATGLGLSIVKALVTGELAGTIEMRGDEHGTTVHVRVPVSMPRVEV